MDMLDEQQEGHAESNDQGKAPVPFAAQAEEQQEHGRGMAGGEKVLGHEFRPIKQIAHRIDQTDQMGRRLQGHQGNGRYPGEAQQGIGPEKYQQDAGILDSPEERQHRHRPDHDKKRDRDVVRGQPAQQWVVEGDTLPELDPLKKERKRRYDRSNEDHPYDHLASETRLTPSSLPFLSNCNEGRLCHTQRSKVAQSQT